MSSPGQVPSWLLTGQPAMCSCGCAGKRKKTGFVEKTIQDVAGVIKEEYFSETLAMQKGFLQGLDPRVKVVTLLGLIGVAGLARHMETLAAMYVGILILAYLSKLQFVFFVKRVWLVVPLFTGMMVLPALFNFVRPGDPVWTLIRFGQDIQLGPWVMPGNLSITRQGLYGAGLLIARVGVSVSLALLLTATTRWQDLLKALRVFLIPKIFVMTLEMTHRYIFLLLQVTGEMFLARKSRTVGPSKIKETRGFVAGAMGTLLGKSYSMSEEVYLAMVARGYQGEARSINHFRMRLADALWLGLSVMLAIALVKGDYYLGI